MIKMIKGKGQFKYYCPKCKIIFETDGEELKECPVCNKEESTLDTKIKQVREKIEKIQPTRTGRNYLLETFDYLVETKDDDTKDEFEKILDECLENEENWVAFLLSLAFYSSQIIKQIKKEK